MHVLGFYLTVFCCCCMSGFLLYPRVAIRRFKKDVSKSGHLFELRRRRYFETNTEKRIRKAAAARRKAKMARQDSRKQEQGGFNRKKRD